jgi:hypothetical protein
MAQTKPKAGQFYGVSDNGTDGQFLQTDGTGGMAWASTITNPTITSIDYPGTQTAADPAGGESVIINGTLFASGITCTVGGTSAVTAFNSATQITITTPAKAAGPYTVDVVNPDGGTASENNFIQYSGVPVWSTAAGTLGNVLEGTAASFQVTATEGSDTIEYAVTTGTLPTGLSLATATGAITGTAPAVSADTTTTFSITATDDENQTSASRSFSITVQNDNPSNYFNTVLYTGNDTTQSISSLNFQPDLVWIKNRNDSFFWHNIWDTVRGVDKGLFPNSTAIEDNQSPRGYLSSFDTNGFTVTSGTTDAGNNNGIGKNIVAWCWKAGGPAVLNTEGTLDTQVSVNNTLGFSIVSGSVPVGGYTNTLGHGLSSAPELIIYKTTDQLQPWFIFSQYGGSLLGNNNVLRFDTSAATSDSLFDITSTTFKTGSTSAAHNYIAYCFASKPDFSKVGSYTGNGSTSGKIVQTGFEPAFLLVKRTDSVSSWRILDNKRFSGNNKSSLIPNSSAAEQVGYIDVSFYTNGFEINSNNADFNASGGNYIYLAIAADGSTATPSLANSFATDIYTGNSTARTISTGFAPDLAWIKNRNNSTNSTHDHSLFDSVRTTGYRVRSNSTGAENDYSSNMSGFTSDGFNLTTSGALNDSGGTYVSWNWKAGGTPSINTDGTITSVVSANQTAGFSIVEYTGTGSNASFGHGLSSLPELVIVKRTSAIEDWFVLYDTTNTPPNYAKLNTTGSGGASSGVFPSPSTSTVVNVGNDTSTNSSGSTYIAYCFTSIPGYSKVGSYSGGFSGSSNVITIGFKPSFLIVKRTDAAGDAWQMFDSVMAGADTFDNYLQANTSAAEASYNQREVNFTNNGFYWTYAESGTNISGGTYIYLAIKEN